MFPYKLGLRRSSKDHRDLKLSVPLNKILPLKCEVPIIRCVYAQGELNSCSSNVICNQIMNLKDLTDNNYPSRLFQYYISRQIAGNEDEDEGCTYRDAYRGLAKFGFTDENLWEYDSNKVFEKPPQKAYDRANKTLIKKYKSLIPSLYNIKYAISEGHIVAFGSMLYENVSDLDTNFVVPYPKGQILGGHAMAIYQYNDETKLFKVLNSWGIDWGLNGMCYMHYDHVVNDTFSFEFWVLEK